MSSPGTGRQAWADDPLTAAILRGAGFDLRPLDALAGALRTRATPNGVAWIDALDRARTTGDAERWRKAWRAFDGSWLAPMAELADGGAKIELVVGGGAHAMRLVARPRSKLARLAFWQRVPAGAALLAQWRERPSPSLGAST